MIDVDKRLVRKPKLWETRLLAALPAIEEARRRGLEPTPYFVEALAYWHRAKALQDMNLGLLERVPVGDRLQEAIPIYDTVNRRYAGFSNVLEAIWYGPAAPKVEANREASRPVYVTKYRGTEEDWLYLCLVHRITGSGASFEADHGWRNSIVSELYEAAPRNRTGIVARHKGPIFTSIGNQIPPFSKLEDPFYRTAGQEYLATDGYPLIVSMLELLSVKRAETRVPVGIKWAVERALELQSELGHKQFKFVLTAWVMDIAEYLPHLVDPKSDCYHGKNAIEALKACFRPGAGAKRQGQDFLDAGTRLFADLMGVHPMDIEDTSPGCDLIRWLENYVPKNGFDHVIKKGIFNSSSLRFPLGRQP